MNKRRAKGEGSVVRLRDGRYQARVTVKGVRVVAYGETRTEAMEKLRAKRGTPVTSSRDLATSLLATWLLHVRPTVGELTYPGYERHCNRHLVPLLGNVSLRQLTFAYVSELQSRLLAQGSAVNTCKVMSTFSQALDYGVSLGLLAGNPARGLKRPRKGKKEFRVLSLEECRSLLSSAKQDAFAGIVCLALDSGMRQGEIFALRWENVDVPGMTIRVVESQISVNGVLKVKEPKRNASRRTVKVCSETIASLGTPGRGLVFPNSLGKLQSPNNWTKRYWTPCRARAGLLGIRFHDLRHTSATHLLLAGVPIKVVSSRLGHSTVTQTLNTYAHLLPESDGAIPEIVSKFYQGI